MADLSFPPARLLKKWAKEIPTPCYVYDEIGLRQHADALFSAFSWNPGLSVVFPVRMNPNPAVLQIFAEAGCALECGTAEELRLARNCGIDGNRILYAPIIRDVPGEQLAIQLRAAWLIHGPQVLPPEPPDTVWLCCNPGGYLTDGGRRICNLDRNKFGMDRETLFSAAARFSEFETTYVGLAFRAGDNELDAAFPAASAKLLLSLAGEVTEKTGVRISGIQLSGMPGVCSREGYEAYGASACSRDIQKCFGDSELDLSLCSGRFLAAESGVFLTRVQHSVQRLHSALFTDCGFSQFPRTMMLGAWNPVSVLGKKTEFGKQLYDIYGCLPDLRDRIAENRVLPPVKDGDILMIHDVGADGFSLSGNYGGIERCSEYLLREDQSFEKL